MDVSNTFSIFPMDLSSTLGHLEDFKQLKGYFDFNYRKTLDIYIKP